MKALNKIIYTVGLVTAIACQTTSARVAASSELQVKTLTANEAGFLVNSHLITGESDAILVDAQFTRSQAKRVVEMVKASGKDLKTVFITHGHPDHYFGLEVLSKEFPRAKVLATKSTVVDIQQTAQGKLEYWKKLYGEDLTDSIVIPEVFEGKSLTLEGNDIELVDLVPGESEHATALYVPSLKALLTGDMVYNQVHLWLAEDRPEGFIQNLRLASKIANVERVLPGHGEPSTQALLSQNITYVEAFLRVTQEAKTKEQAIANMKKLYPSFRLPIILELSVGARMK